MYRLMFSGLEDINPRPRLMIHVLLFLSTLLILLTFCHILGTYIYIRSPPVNAP